ncbi:MAG: FAD-dependent monooxygenase [Gammaproteobacteria bacterium]
MHFDIIIIGGGMVGASLACALRSSQFNVAMIDSAPLNTTEDHRLIALNYSSVCLLKNLNVWPQLKSFAAAIKEVHVSNQGHFGITRLTAREFNLPELGAVVPAKHINPALYAALGDTTLIRPATLKQLEQNADQVILTVDTPEGAKELTAKIVIGADGSHSTVRDLLNIPTQKIDYEQSALVTTTQLNRPHHNIAYERFSQGGAIAMLPLVGNEVATIWTQDRDQITKLMQLSDTEFLAQLQKQFGYRLGRLIKTSQRFTYPLQMIQAEQQIKHRVILLGNALHTLSPIAAQGLNLALYEISVLHDYFAQYAIDSLSLTDFATQQQKFSLGLSHNLNWLFSQDFFIMNTARAMGMLGIDLCQPLKEKFIRRAIGQTGRIPTLLMERETHENYRTE